VAIKEVGGANSAGMCVLRGGRRGSISAALDQLSAAGADAALKLILSISLSPIHCRPRLTHTHMCLLQIDAFALIGVAHTPRRESGEIAQRRKQNPLD
jgi:hypothetical protein